MKLAHLGMALLMTVGSSGRFASAQNLVPNGDFEGLVLDENEAPVLDDYGLEQPVAWFRSTTDPGTFPVPGTELISPANMNNSASNDLGDDSDGVGANSIALNYLEDVSNPPLGIGVDWRSEAFATVSGETLIFSIDVKFIGVSQMEFSPGSGLFEGSLAQVRSFTQQAPDGGTGGSFVGELNVTLQAKDFMLDAWHRVTQSLVIPGGGEWTDVRISSNLFIPPSPLFGGQILFDRVSVVRLTADFDDDGDVDGADLEVWRPAFSTTADADADGDGDSDGADFLAWQSQFGLGVAPAAPSRAIPEPSGGALAAIGALAALVRRRLARVG